MLGNECLMPSSRTGVYPNKRETVVRRMTTSNGAVDVAFRGEASVELDASTSRGRARSELPISGVTLEEDRLVGAIGDGEADLFTDTSNGSITIR